ncbi:large proline-rich protein BAG6 isoform X2 [Ceratina calcarata]|uniref:Large proline-rich protein BAG6 n=1 Tax=Ceratina calcarata TaxID=156304 RepID=A0AAJ7NFT5_9HYME|nr:large proline-rich protein BAG6 isoform X2 [Ceratina calcarata]
MINLTVKTLDSQNHPFSLEDDQITVREFKEYIAETVAVPADSQRLIYCGRVLHDRMKLNDYDVNGKVIHLVQRAPPQPNRCGNDRGQNQNQSSGSVNWHHNPLRPQHHRLSRMQRHAMYLGAMAVPAGVVAEHGTNSIPIPQFSSSFSNSRLVAARHMLERADRVMDRLENPRSSNLPTAETNPPSLGQLMQESEIDVEQPLSSENEGRTNNGARLIETAIAAIAAALSTAGANNVTLVRGSSDEISESRPVVNESNEETQPDTQRQQPQQQQQPQPQTQPQPQPQTQPQPQPQTQPQSQSQPQQEQEPEQGSTSTSDGQGNPRTPVVPRLSRLAEMLDLLLDTQDRLRPHIERYRKIMHDDPSLPPGERVEENQTYVNGVGECIHYMSHACHSLSDVIVDMSQEPPRTLRCRPIVIQHSAIWRNPGIPIQAHISLHGRNANNNNGNEENGESGSAPTQAETSETNTENSSQQQEFPCTTPAQTEQPEQQQQQQSEPLFSFNLPHDVELLMEVAPEGNIDAVSGDEQTQSSETNNNNNNNNNNGARVSATTGTFSWGSPNFLRDLMQTVAGHMIQGGTATVIQQTVAPVDTGNTNAGQSTQARSNVGTHPTTATRTRSTSRPHRFRHVTHPVGGGMSLGPTYDFDPFLPCQSHHVRHTSSFTSSPVTSPSQGTRTNQTTTAETQTQPQTATTSSATSNTSSTNTTASTTSQANMNDPAIYLLHQVLGSTGTQPQTTININSDNPGMAETLGNMLQMYTGGTVHVGITGPGNDNPVRDVTLANLLERRGIQMSIFTSQAENFLVNLCVLVVQNMTLEGLIRLRIGQSEPLSNLRAPLQEFFRQSFPNVPTETIQEQAIERMLLLLRPHFENLLNAEEDNNRNGSRIDLCATIEALFRRHIKDILHHLFNNEIDDANFGQEVFIIVNNMGRELCAVLRYSIRGGQEGLELMASRFVTEMLEGIHPTMRRLIVNAFVIQFRIYSLLVIQPPESEILPLLIYKEVPPQATIVSTAATHQPSQPQSDIEPMETETVEVRTTLEASSLPEDGDEIPETFPGHEVLPSDWVPIIARDGVRQRRQLQMQGITNGGVAAFSDAYLGTLPTKRRKLIEQQKPRLLVSPTPNHSAIAASMERLVREGVIRAGVEENEGAAVAVAVDPGVRHAFGQAIRDSLNPNRYGTPDFPDPSRFPNATKYFADQDRPQK